MTTVAQHIETRLTCDLDEDLVDAVETVSFAYEGKDYVLDLCPDHLDEYREVETTWTLAARPTRSA